MVSVIIPTYKGSSFLKRSIDSVLNQNNYGDYEIIVVDDNSPEDQERTKTECVMQTYDGNNRIKYIKQESKGNGASARNKGVKSAKGDLVCFLDDDDIFLPDKLYMQTKYMDEHPEVEGSYTWRYNSDGSLVKYNKTGDLSKELLLLEFFPTTITLMIRKNIYTSMHGFDESFVRHQDYEFLLRFFRQYKLGVVKAPLSRIIGKGKTRLNNQLEGKELERLKTKFLTTFEKEISDLDLTTHGFKKEVYAVHYADVFASHIRNKHFLLAIKLSFVAMRKSGIIFFKKVYQHYRIALSRSN